MFKEVVFNEVKNITPCPHFGPDPIIMLGIGVAIGLFLGLNIMLIYVKIYGSPFESYEDDESEEPEDTQ